MDFGIAETGIARGSPPGTTTEVLRVGFPSAEIRVVSHTRDTHIHLVYPVLYSFSKISHSHFQSTYTILKKSFWPNKVQS
jgi:hypothetical protein